MEPPLHPRHFHSRWPVVRSQFVKATVKRHKSSRPGQPTPANEERASKAVPVPNTVPILPLWQRLGPLSTVLQAYARSQRARPLTTQLCSSLIIYLCGDLGAQYIGRDDYDPWRTLRAVIIGVVCSIPSYRWFIWLGESFDYPSKLLSLGIKVVVNQLLFTPIFNSYFFGAQSLLSGDDLAGAWERIQCTVPTSFVNSCKLWPAVTAFSFTFIQPQYRSVFAGLIAIGWQTYLSFLNQRAVEAVNLARHEDDAISIVS